MRLLIAILLALIFLAALQIAFFNSLFFYFNIFLNLILVLVLTGYNKSAFFFGWISGLLIDTARFSSFGVSSLVFLIIAFTLIIIYKMAFFSLKTEKIVFMALLSVFLYYSAEWSILNGLALLSRGDFESFGAQIISWNFLIEIITTAFLTLIIFKSFRTLFDNEQKI